MLVFTAESTAAKHVDVFVQLPFVRFHSFSFCHVPLLVTPHWSIYFIFISGFKKCKVVVLFYFDSVFIDHIINDDSMVFLYGYFSKLFKAHFC